MELFDKRAKAAIKEIMAARKVEGPDVFKKNIVDQMDRMGNIYQHESVKQSSARFALALRETKHRISAAEAETGVGIAPLIAGQLQLGKIFKRGNNMGLLLTELQGRVDQHVADDGMTEAEAEQLMNEARESNLSKLKVLLKQDEKKRIGRALDATFIVPKHTDVGDYDYDVVRKRV